MVGGPVPRIHYMARLLPRIGPPYEHERRVWVSRLYSALDLRYATAIIRALHDMAVIARNVRFVHVMKECNGLILL